MDESTPSFGYWIRRRRMALDLTQRELARLVGCASVTIKKIEADERRPSRLMAERLAGSLSIPADQVARFVQTAIGEWSPDRTPLAKQPLHSSMSAASGPDELQQEDPDRRSYPFAGRERELSALLDHLQRAREGAGQVVFVSGEAGRGKTTLLTEFAWRAMAAHPDLVVARGNCNAFGGAGDPYLPFRDVLNELLGAGAHGWTRHVLSKEHARRLLAFGPDVRRTLAAEGPDVIRVLRPEIAAAGRPRRVDGAARSGRLAGEQESPPEKREPLFLFDQITQVFHTLSRRRPLLIILDDVQWADSASISLLFHLGMRLAGTRLLVACAHRPNEFAPAGGGEGPSHAGRDAFSEMAGEFRRRFGAIWYDLSQADESENWGFLNALLDTEPNRLDDTFRRALFRRTGGHPLFMVEMLRDMQARGDMVMDAAEGWRLVSPIDWEALPARVEAVIQTRVEHLTPDLREILSIASVEGESFTAQVVAQILNKDERVVLHQLSGELEARHGLVREAGAVETREGILTRYTFRHVLFQDYFYRRLGRGERRLLHREIAAFLERVYGSDHREIVPELAHHFRQAGVQDKALAYARRAAQRAEAMCAYDEAVHYLQYALELLPLEEEAALRTAILEQMADDYVLLGERPRAIALYDKALIGMDQSASEGLMDRVRVHRKIGETVSNTMLFEIRRRFADEATQHFRAGQMLIKDRPAHPEAVRLLTAMVNGACSSRSTPDWKPVEELAQHALRMAEQLGSPVELSRALEALANVYVGQGLFRERLAVSLRTLELSRAPMFGDVRQRAGMLQQTGYAHSQVGEYRKALPFLIEAEEASGRLQDLHVLYRAIRHQATCYFRLDEWDRVLELEGKRQSLERRYPNFSERAGST